MTDKPQSQEMQNAKNENRIPKCTSCNHEIHKIIQTQQDYIDWSWNDKTHQYYKGDYDGTADKPVHDCKECTCQYGTWDFLDENSDVCLGVAF